MSEWKLPFVVGVIPLWVTFWLGFIVWWELMALLFKQGAYVSAIIIAYALPTTYTAAVWFASRRKEQYMKILHFCSFISLSVIFVVVFTVLGGVITVDYGAWLSMAFIAAVMAIMQYPKAGLENYEAYRPSLFIGGVIFMPLFIYIAALLPNVPSPPAIDKAILFPLGMLGFWLSGAWLVSRRVQGRHVSGLEIRPLMPFRPDFILPGGVTYVKGVIMVGVGLMIMIHPVFGMPKWNWWGFTLAFWGIITLIPLRGMYKMIKGRRLRMLGKGGVGFKAEFYKGLILFIGLNILLYGFVNAFFGTIPFLELGVKPEYNALMSGHFLTGFFGLAMLVGSFVILVLVRGWYKTQLLEGIESTRQLINKQLLLYIGTLALVIAYIHLLYLPPIRKLGVLWVYPDTNPLGFLVGLTLFLAGSALILVLRPLALKNEWEATVTTMVGVISDLPEQMRDWVMKQRLEILSSMPEKQRNEHVRLMMAGLNDLPEEKRTVMMRTQMALLADLDSEKRQNLMRSMDAAMMGGDM